VKNKVIENSFSSVALALCFTLGLVLLVPAFANAQAFVQFTDNGSAPAQSASVNVTFTNPQAAGNLNVVVVGWSDTTSSVESVTDTNLNNYAVAVGTNAHTGISQAIYYASSVNAGANTITVNFRAGAPAAFPDVRAIEYSGVSTTTPLNVSAGAAGSGTAANSGSATANTSASTSFLVAAGGSTNQSFSHTASFNIEDYDANGNIAGESIAAGPSFNVTATVGTSAPWVLQLAAFGNAATTFAAPTLVANPVSPASGFDSGGDTVTITGTNFAAGAVVLFGAAGTPPTGISGVNCTVTAPTTISCTTPADVHGPKDVSVINPDGKFATAVGGFTYNVVTPSITSVTPSTDFTNGGAAITISGTNFVSPVSVTFDGVLASNVVVVNATTITANTTAHAVGSANLVVTNVSEGSSTPFAFTYSLGSGPINFIQSEDSGSAPHSSAAVVATMPLSQTAGNLNVVAIGWSDTTAHTLTVQDSEGNTYTQALNATIGLGTGQAMYYAKNIKGGGPSNAVTVTFNPAAAFPDVRVAEYSGLDPTSPLDQVSALSGNGGIASSGPITVAASELVVGAGTTDGAFTGSGTGFATVDITANGNDLEHQVAPPVGIVTAQAPVSGNWVMQAVSFFHGAPVPDFSFSPAPAPASNTLTAGTSTSYTISVSALNGFSAAVALSCSAGLPTGASCTFAPTSVTPGASPATSTLTISTTTATPGGTDTVTITGTSGASHTTSVGLVVQAAPGFTLAATALTPASVAPGGSATSTITVTGLNGFNANTVTLTCSSITGGGQPAPTCAFSALSGGTSTLTVSTTPNSAANPSKPTASSPRATGLFYALLLPIGGMTLLGAGFSSRRKKLLGILLIGMMVAGFIFMSACGGGSSTTPPPPSGGTPAGTYTITVSGAATGATTQTAPLTLTVN
jgi:IPT/TIG domain